MRLWLLYASVLMCLGLGSGPAWARTSVLVTEGRLALLKDDISNHFEPTWKGWQALRQACELDLAHAPAPPDTVTVVSKDDMRAIQVLIDDGRIAYEEALAYRITGDARYGKEARRILTAWATGLPAVGIEDRTRLAVSRYFPVFIFAADLMRRTPLWLPADETAFTALLMQRILPASTSRWRFDGLQDAPGVGNSHAIWGVLLDASVAAYVDDRALLNLARRRWIELVDGQIASDGTLPLELDSSAKKTKHRKPINARWYTHLTVWGMTLGAEVLANNDMDVYDLEAGQRLHTAFDRTVEWTINPSHFPFLSAPSKIGTDDFGYFMILNHHFPNVDAEWLLRHRRYRVDGMVPFLIFSHGAR